jgi:hypothetical protein
MNPARIVTAVLLLVTFGAFAVFLVLNADTGNAVEWERWVYVFGAIQAPAFTAIGWLFGREVNRERADAAERRAGEADAERAEAEVNGAKLAGMVVAAEGGTASAGGPRLERHGAAPAGGVSEAVAFARRMYDLPPAPEGRDRQ